MPAFLLDTNIVSYLLKQPESVLAERVGSMDARRFCISTITEAELLYWLQRLPAAARMQQLVPRLLADIRIQPWASACAARYATLAAAQRASGDTLSLFDLMIAAHALANDMTLVTHDNAFQRVDGLRVEDWTVPA